MTLATFRLNSIFHETMNLILDVLDEILDKDHEIFPLLCSSRPFLLALSPNIISATNRELFRGCSTAIFDFLFDIAVTQSASSSSSSSIDIEPSKENDDECNARAGPHAILPTLRYVNRIQSMVPWKSESMLKKNLQRDPDLLIKNPSEKITSEYFSEVTIKNVLAVTQCRIVTEVSLHGASSQFFYTDSISSLVRRPGTPMCHLEVVTLSVAFEDAETTINRILRDLTPAPNLRKLDLQFGFRTQTKGPRVQDVELWKPLLQSTQKKMRALDFSGVAVCDRFFDLVSEHAPFLEVFSAISMQAVTTECLMNFFSQQHFLKDVYINTWSGMEDDESNNNNNEGVSSTPITVLVENCGPRLTRLHPPRLFDFELFAIGKNCQQLEFISFGRLDVTHSFTDAGVIAVWKGCKKLKEVEIMETKTISGDKLTEAAFIAFGDEFAGSKTMKKFNFDGKDDRALNQQKYIDGKVPGCETIRCF